MPKQPLEKDNIDDLTEEELRERAKRFVFEPDDIIVIDDGEEEEDAGN